MWSPPEYNRGRSGEKFRAVDRPGFLGFKTELIYTRPYTTNSDRSKRRNSSQDGSSQGGSYRATVNPSKRHRDRLNAELENLAKLLPLSEDIIARLDKLSVLRLSVSYLKNKNFFKGLHLREENGAAQETQPPRSQVVPFSRKQGLFSYLFNEAIDGFILVVTSDGEIFMISESVKSYLGYSQSQTLHQSLYTLVHEDDHEELRSNLSMVGSSPKIIELDARGSLADPPEKDEELVTRELVVRMKSVLNTSSSDMYRPFKITGTIREIDTDPESKKPQKALFAVCTPARSSHSILEIRMKSTLFCSKNRLDLSFLDMDARGKEFFGYTKKDLFGRSSYVMVHRADLQHLRCKHTEIITVGKTTLATFRLLNKSNEWSWVCGYARVLYKHARADFVVTTNRLMSEEEGQAMLRIRDDGDCQALGLMGFCLPENQEDAMKLGFPLSDSTQQTPRQCTIDFNLSPPLRPSPGNMSRTSQIDTDDLLTDSPENLFKISDDLMNSSPEEILVSPDEMSPASGDYSFGLSSKLFVSSVQQGRSPGNESGANLSDMPTTCASVLSDSLGTLGDNGTAEDSVTAAFRRQLSSGSSSMKGENGFGGNRGIVGGRDPKLSVASLASTLNSLDVHHDPNALQSDTGALFDEISMLDSYLNQHSLPTAKGMHVNTGSSPGHTLTDLSQSAPQVRSYGNFHPAVNANGRVGKSPVGVQGQNGLSGQGGRGSDGILRVAPQLSPVNSRDPQDKKKTLLTNGSFTNAMYDLAPPNVTVTASDSNLQNIQNTLGIPRTTLGHSASPTFPFMNTQSPTMSWNGPQQQQHCGPQSISTDQLNTTVGQLVATQGPVVNHVGMVTQSMQGVRGFFPQFVARDPQGQRGARQSYSSWI